MPQPKPVHTVAIPDAATWAGYLSGTVYAIQHITKPENSNGDEVWHLLRLLDQLLPTEQDLAPR